MSTDTPVQIVVAAFNDDAGASVALTDLKQARDARLIEIEAAAVLRKDDKGKLHVKETADMSGRKGATLGGVAGAAIGLLAGPALVVPAAVGALIGGLAARARDSGFSNSGLEKIGESLTPGSSALIAVVKHAWVDRLKEELAREGAEMLTEQLQADIARQLEAGHDVAYSALASTQGFAAGRFVNGGDEEEVHVVVADGDDVLEEQWIATSDGFAVQSGDDVATQAASSSSVEDAGSN